VVRFALKRTRRATALTLEARRAAQYEQGFGNASCAHGHGADAESSCDDADDEQECGGVKHGDLARLSSLQILRSKAPVPHYHALQRKSDEPGSPYELIELIDVGLVVLAVVKRQCFSGDQELEWVLRIRQGW
jgi:hypothetical protein